MTTRVGDAIRMAELARQRARLFSEARRMLARRYLGDTRSGVELDVLSQVLEHLLLAANDAEQDAQAEFAKPLAGVGKRRVGTGRHEHP